MTAVYTAEARSTGAGRTGHVRSTDGVIELDLGAPEALGGDRPAANPEMLFAAGYAACFHSTMRTLAAARKLEIGATTVDAAVGIGPDDEGGWILNVDLEVRIPVLTHEAAQELVTATHRICPYSKAVRGNIEVVVGVAD